VHRTYTSHSWLSKTVSTCPPTTPSALSQVVWIDSDDEEGDDDDGGGRQDKIGQQQQQEEGAVAVVVVAAAGPPLVVAIGTHRLSRTNQTMSSRRLRLCFLT